MHTRGNRRKVLVIGVDGADPLMLKRLLRAGDLPHMAKLISTGSFGPLETTFPPVSPVAWGSFLTGVSPARHGIRDFVTKAPGTYRPTIGLFTISADASGLPVYTSRRRAPSDTRRQRAHQLSAESPWHLPSRPRPRRHARWPGYARPARLLRHLGVVHHRSRPQT